jgi:hypothetical protein
MAALPETVTLPTETVIELAGTLMAFDYLTTIIQSRTSPNILDEVFEPMGRDLLKSAGLYGRDREPENDVERTVHAMIDRQESEMTALLLDRIAAWATAEAEETRRIAEGLPFAAALA